MSTHTKDSLSCLAEGKKQKIMKKKTSMARDGEEKKVAEVGRKRKRKEK